MEKQGFEEVEHTADWAIRVVGETIPELFSNAAHGMIELTGANAIDTSRSSRTFRLEALDLETLLVSWLEELLFGMEMRNVTYEDIHLDLEEGPKLTVQLNEIPATFRKSPIKAVTFNDMRIVQTDSGFEVVIVFDV